MRTTLDLDDSVLDAARALARQQRTSLGAAVSALASRGLAAGPPIGAVRGFPTFESDAAAPITLEIVNRHRDA